MSTVLEQNQDVVKQAISVLEILNPEHYVHAAAPVGPHFRHCVDFYRCFLDGIDVRCIDYDARQRGGDPERSPVSAVSAFSEILGRLESIPNEEIERMIEVRSDAAGSPESWSRSTVRRELQFLLSHTVHHFALVALLLRQQGFELPADFGFAPSTLEHARSNSQ